MQTRHAYRVQYHPQYQITLQLTNGNPSHFGETYDFEEEELVDEGDAAGGGYFKE